jgi:hypothetical protein
MKPFLALDFSNSGVIDLRKLAELALVIFCIGAVIWWISNRRT